MNDVVTVEKFGSSQGIGASVRRIEDLRFLRGLGRYTDDTVVPNAAHMIVVRSPYAAAKIVSIDTAAAKACPGVITVLTGADADADGLGKMLPLLPRFQRDGKPAVPTDYRLLATDQARFAGDAVAIVIGETRAAALDGAELVDVQYEPLPAVTDVELAAAPGAPAVWPDRAPDNVCFVHLAGNKAACDAAFAKAAHVTTYEFRVSRLSANPMEPRNAIGFYDIAEQRWTLISGTQGPHATRNVLADQIFKVDHHRIRVVSNDVGGGFGLKGGAFPEQALVLWAAQKTRRPVRWTATRSESLLSDYHCRDNVTRLELALDADGIFLGLRVHTLAALGAYMAGSTPIAPVGNLGGLAGTYRTPAFDVEVIGLFTNTQPTSPYRGAGRPEATYAIERIIDKAAGELGLDRVDLRRRNLIPPEAMPYQTALIYRYDSGNFPANMDKALAFADWDGFPARRAASEARGKLRGISITNAIEIAGGPPRTPLDEGAELRFDTSGTLTMVLGSHNHGQGHETVFRQIANSHLGVDPSRIKVLFGDTDIVAHGRGTFGSRSMSAGGGAVLLAAQKIIERGKLLAGHLLEADPGDIEFEDGTFRVAGTDKILRIEDVAKISYTPGKLPKGQEIGLQAQAMLAQQDATFPNGVHIVEVEIDPETGETAVVRYFVVDDVGTVINPLLVKGQIHGGVAQGLSQVLFERVEYDPASGQMITGSFTDYAMPRADDMPAVEVTTNPSPTTVNTLGAKGAGEAGTVGALPGVMNAILDALKPYGVTELPMPATAEKIWQAIQKT